MDSSKYGRGDVFHLTQRMKAISRLLNELRDQFRSPFTLAVCGSTAFGVLHAESDVELFIVIKKADISSLLVTDLVSRVFTSKADSEVAAKVADGGIDAVRLAETVFCNISFCINIYTAELCEKFATLAPATAVKFRDDAKIDMSPDFRGFSFASDGRTVRRPGESWESGTGVLVRSEIAACIEEKWYFHIYADKFISAFLVWDELNVRAIQSRFENRLQQIARGSGFCDAYAFLYKYDVASETQKSRLLNRHLKTASEDSISSRQKGLCQVSGAPGVGKDAVITGLRERYSSVGTVMPYTTRAKRSITEREYCYVSEADFCNLISDEQFLFWHYDGDDDMGYPKYYGLTHNSIDLALNRYDHVLFSIGRSVAARFFKCRFPSSKAVCLFPDSTEQLVRQVASRAGEAPQELQRRLLFFDQSESESQYCIHVRNSSGQINRTIETVAKFIGVSHAE